VYPRQLVRITGTVHARMDPCLSVDFGNAGLPPHNLPRPLPLVPAPATNNLSPPRTKLMPSHVGHRRTDTRGQERTRHGLSLHHSSPCRSCWFTSLMIRRCPSPTADCWSECCTPTLKKRGTEKEPRAERESAAAHVITYLEPDCDCRVDPPRRRRHGGAGVGRGGVEHAEQRLVLVQRQRVAHEHHLLPAPHPKQRQPVEPAHPGGGYGNFSRS
jgi:hypothetical protein